MTSLLCVQEPGGFVEHNSKEYSEDILRDSANHAIFAKYFPDDKVRPRFLNKRPFSTPNPQIVTDNIDSSRLMGHSMKLQAWLNNKTVKHIQEKSDSEAKPVKEMYGAVLDREDTFVKGMLGYCDKHDYLNTRKKEILHKNWNERVYEPIRKAVIEQMDNGNYISYKIRKDQLYREYIEHLNRKDHVFRDDYDPSEYYAMGLHADRPAVAQGLQASTERLRDPTLLQEQNRNKEDQTILRCISGTVYKDKSLDTVRLPMLPLAPKGRHGTENDTWLAMNLTDIESDVRKASRIPINSLPNCGQEFPNNFGIDNEKTRRMVGTNLKSEINFGNWSLQNYGKETVEREMGTQKKRQCKQPPFTAPRVIGGARKRLPAAKESHRSKTLPFTNRKYLEYNYDPPFGLDLQTDNDRVQTQTRATAVAQKEDTTPTLDKQALDTLRQTDVVF